MIVHTIILRAYEREHVFWNIPEQFTVKAHPALFGGRGKNNEDYFSQLTNKYYFTAKIMLEYC